MAAVIASKRERQRFKFEVERYQEDRTAAQQQRSQDYKREFYAKLLGHLDGSLRALAGKSLVRGKGEVADAGTRDAGIVLMALLWECRLLSLPVWDQATQVWKALGDAGGEMASQSHDAEKATRSLLNASRELFELSNVMYGDLNTPGVAQQRAGLSGRSIQGHVTPGF